MKKIIQFILYTVGVLYLPCLAIISAMADQRSSFIVFPFGLLFLLLFLISFHYLCVFLELGFTVLRIFEKKERSVGEKIFNMASVLLGIALIITIILEPEISFATMTISSLLLLMWILGDIIFKQRKFFPMVFKKKSFWITSTAIFVAVCVFLAISTGKFGNKGGTPDPLDPSLEETHELNL